METIKLYQHQQEGVDFLLKRGSGMLAFDVGLGKAQKDSDFVLTDRGYVTISNLKIGDKIANPDGTFSNLLKKFPQGKQDIYEITFNDGSKTYSTKDHLWNVNTTTRNSRGKEFLTMRLEDIMQNYKLKNGGNKWYIPITKPIEFNKQDHIIHPYLLGVLLGDGGLGGRNSCYITKVNPELFDFIKGILPDNCYLQYKDKVTYRINSYDKQYNIVNREILSMGLNVTSEKKFIPTEYQVDSVNNRLLLLQGLMDTDGYVSENGDCIQYGSTSKILALHVQFLVESLGGVAQLRIKSKINTITKRIGKPYYELTINLGDINPFLIIKRKIDRWKPRIKYKPNRAIKEIRYHSNEFATCILVDNPNHLYLTNNFIVTHNTPTAITVAQKWGGYILIACPAYLVDNWVREWEKWTGNKPYYLAKKAELMEGNATVIIGSYSMLKKRYEMGRLKPTAFTTIICDESQALKNASSQRSKFIRGFSKFIPHRILLSATPMVNRPLELWPQLQMIDPDKWKNWMDFTMTYCVKHPRFNYYLKDASKNTDKLAANLALYAIRRKNEDVLDMPKLVRKEMYVDIFRDNGYIVANIKELVKKEDMKEALKELIAYRKKLELHKAMWFLKMVKSDYSLWENKKVLVGVQFRDTAKYLAENLNTGMYVTGDIDAVKRVGIIQGEFKNNPEYNFLFATIPSVAEGLNLDWIDEVHILGLGWTPSQHQQFEGRLRRITRKNIVVSHYYICSNTVDDFIYRKLRTKASLIDQIVDGKQVKIEKTSIQQEYLNYLLNDKI